MLPREKERFQMLFWLKMMSSMMLLWNKLWLVNKWHNFAKKNFNNLKNKGVKFQNKRYFLWYESTCDSAAPFLIWHCFNSAQLNSKTVTTTTTFIASRTAVSLPQSSANRCPSTSQSVWLSVSLCASTLCAALILLLLLLLPLRSSPKTAVANNSCPISSLFLSLLTFTHRKLNSKIQIY